MQRDKYSCCRPHRPDSNRPLAEAFDAVGFGDKLFDEGNHLFPWKAERMQLSTIESGRSSAGRSCSPSSVEWESRSFSEQLQTESAVGAAGDVAVGIDSTDLCFDGGEQLGGNQVCFVDNRQMTVAQLKTNHLYILDLLHEVVRIDQADDALHLIGVREQGAV